MRDYVMEGRKYLSLAFHRSKGFLTGQRKRQCKRHVSGT